MRIWTRETHTRCVALVSTEIFERNTPLSCKQQVACVPEDILQYSIATNQNLRKCLLIRHPLHMSLALRGSKMKGPA